MCLAIPMKIVELLPNSRAKVDAEGVFMEISLHLVNDAGPGDYVLVHAGFALEKIDASDAEETLDLFRQLAASRDITE